MTIEWTKAKAKKYMKNNEIHYGNVFNTITEIRKDVDYLKKTSVVNNQLTKKDVLDIFSGFAKDKKGLLIKEDTNYRGKRVKTSAYISMINFLWEFGDYFIIFANEPTNSREE